MLNKKVAGAPWCCVSASAWFSAVKLLFVVLILVPTLIHASPQSQPTLQIISPTPKTVVNPGQTVTVSVTSPTPGAFSGVELTGDDPLGFVGTVSVLPAQIPVTIPLSQIDCGSYFLTVSGTPTSGQGPVSAIVELDVERSDFPLTISAALSPIIFDSAGEQIRLDLLAGFADGTTFGVTASSYVTYSSSNTSVATVDSTGLVTAVAPGSGSVTVTYALGSNNNQIFVPVSVPNPVNTAPPAPTITNLSLGSGVGTSATITGTNFGASQGTSTVAFNGTAATPNWSATSIAVPARMRA
jgi:Bacterial Ig-like domain (group 2)